MTTDTLSATGDRSTEQGVKHYNYEPGDQIQDLTFDPPLNGVVTGKHKTPDAYYVRIQNGINDVIIHARNLRRA